MTRGRVLIAVTHLLGTGHISRAAMIASGLAEARFEVTLASGGMPAPTIDDGAYRFVQLAPVRIVGTDYGNLLDADGAPVTARQRAERLAALTAVVEETRPQAVITEHFPFGRPQLADEFMALIAAAQAADPKVRILGSIRDVLVAPRPARETEIAARVRELYDAILVHGDEAFLPLTRSWPAMPTDIARKLTYTGYVAKPRANGQPAVFARRLADGGEIIVSGGGSAAALPLFGAAVAAARHRANVHPWRILVGHGVPEAQFRRLSEQAGGGESSGLVVERARRDFPALLAGCAASVSQGGYNTVIDLMNSGRPAVVVPYVDDSETDQVIRAQAMADAGVCAVCDSSSLTPESLLAAVHEAIGRGTAPGHGIKLDGVAETARMVGALLDAHGTAVHDAQR